MSTETDIYHNIAEQTRLLREIRDAQVSQAAIAAQMMAAWIAAGELTRINDEGINTAADTAVRAADALLARLQQGGEGGGV